MPIVGGPAGAFRVLFVERYDGVIDLHSLHEVARIGDAVNRFGRVDDANPLCTADDCLSFNSQPHTVVLNDAGDVAFVACQSLTNCGVVKARWNASTSDYDLDLVVKNGDTDTAGAALSGNALGRFMLNRFGQLAFFSISSPDGHGIWAWDESLGLVRVVAPGDVLTFPRADPGPDLQRTFRAISLAGENLNCVASGGADGRPSCFNDHGQIVFNAHFVEGGEAIVLATLPHSLQITQLPAGTPNPSLSGGKAQMLVVAADENSAHALFYDWSADLFVLAGGWRWRVR